MKEAKGTIYKCEHCGKAHFTERGCKIHEQHHCKARPQKKLREPDERLGIPLFSAAGE